MPNKEVAMNIDPATVGLRKLGVSEHRRADDFASILTAENQDGGSWWTYSDLVKFLGKPHAHAEIAEAYEQKRTRKQALHVVGHVLYVVYPCSIQLVSVAVQIDCLRQGVGRVILRQMERRLSGKIATLYGDVDADNLAGLQWLRACGVRNSRCVYTGPKGKQKEWVRFSVDVTEAAMACG